MDWKEYQEEAARFFRSLGLVAKTNARLPGVRSDHDIDVLVTFEKWGLTHRWIVDCKLHAKPIEKSYVETLKAIVNEVGASIGFLVAEAGFQSGAHDAATKTNIVLTSLAELKAKARGDVIAQALHALDSRILELQEQTRQFIVVVEEGPGHASLRRRDGVDGDYLEKVGQLGWCRSAIDRAKLGQFPITVPSGDEFHRCGDVETVLHCASGAVEAVNAWIARQKPS